MPPNIPYNHLVSPKGLLVSGLVGSMPEMSPAHHRCATDTEKGKDPRDQVRPPLEGREATRRSARLKGVPTLSPAPSRGSRPVRSTAFLASARSPASAPCRYTWSRFLCADLAFWTSCPWSRGPSGPQPAASVHAPCSSCSCTQLPSAPWGYFL